MHIYTKSQSRLTGCMCIALLPLSVLQIFTEQQIQHCKRCSCRLSTKCLYNFALQISCVKAMCPCASVIQTQPLSKIRKGHEGGMYSHIIQDSAAQKERRPGAALQTVWAVMLHLSQVVQEKTGSSPVATARIEKYELHPFAPLAHAAWPPVSGLKESCD